MSMAECNIVLMSTTGAVGKSALILRYVCNEFLQGYERTIEDTYRKKTKFLQEHDQKENEWMDVTVNITDTGDQKEFPSLENEWILKGQGFIIVYDVTKEKTFTDIGELVSKIKKKKRSTVPILLVGTKADLDEREVTIPMAEETSKQLKCPVLETNAALKLQQSGSNVVAAFDTMIKLINDHPCNVAEKTVAERIAYFEDGCSNNAAQCATETAPFAP